MADKDIEQLGRWIIEMVRDPTIVAWSNTIGARAQNSQATIDLQPVLSDLTAEQIEGLKQLVPIIVDYTLVSLFLLFEEETRIHISLQTQEKVVSDIRKAASGDLQGYIYKWAEQFSTQPLSHRKG